MEFNKKESSTATSSILSSGSLIHNKNNNNNNNNNCKLCEIGSSCLHNGIIPPVQVNFNYDSNFIKDMMLAALFLKGICKKNDYYYYYFLKVSFSVWL